MNQDISIRPATPADAAALLAVYKPYVEHTAVTFEYEVPTEEEFAARIAHTLKRYPYLVAETADGILGYAYAGAFKERAAYDWSVETSIYIAVGKKRQGTGRLLYDALESLLAQQGILNVNACIATPAGEDEYLNMDSVRFHERLGYRMVGEFRQCGYKFGRWYHMVWMEKHIGTHLPDQPPVIPFPELMQHKTTFP